MTELQERLNLAKVSQQSFGCLQLYWCTGGNAALSVAAKEIQELFVRQLHITTSRSGPLEYGHYNIETTLWLILVHETFVSQQFLACFAGRLTPCLADTWESGRYVV